MNSCHLPGWCMSEMHHEVSNECLYWKTAKQTAAFHLAACRASVGIIMDVQSVMYELS